MSDKKKSRDPVEALFNAIGFRPRQKPDPLELKLQETKLQEGYDATQEIPTDQWEAMIRKEGRIHPEVPVKDKRFFPKKDTHSRD